MEHPMKNLYLSVSAIALLFVVTPAYAADEGSYSATTKVEQEADGSYKKEIKEEATNTDGTKESTKTEEKLDITADGKKASVKTETAIDPEGLMNKSVSKTEQTEKVDDEGNVETKTVTESKTNGGTKEKVETKTNVKRDKDSKKTTQTVTKERDPKGLMNKTKEKIVDTTVEGADGSVDVKHETTVNGETVTESQEKIEPAAQ
jgi:hypothetical protein